MPLAMGATLSFAVPIRVDGVRRDVLWWFDYVVGSSVGLPAYDESHGFFSANMTNDMVDGVVRRVRFGVGHRLYCRYVDWMPRVWGVVLLRTSCEWPHRRAVPRARFGHLVLYKYPSRRAGRWR